MTPPGKGTSTVRLESGEGDRRLFWEITRTKATITTRFGRVLNAGRSLTKTFKSTAAAEEAFASAIEEKRNGGYAERAQRAEVGSSATKGVSTRDPTLEALIDEDPRDPQRYLVYADWLQQQSDARGELIVIHHGRLLYDGALTGLAERMAPYKLVRVTLSDYTDLAPYGDVLAHALCDALLGAAGLGDIGTHFPDTDPKWKGANSLQFLEHARKLLDEKRMAIEHVDAVVILERPKLGPHFPKMREALAKSLGVTPAQRRNSR